MDPCDTTNVLFSKIRIIDPENASKIMGYILIQDLAERDLMRLAFGPDTVLQSLVLKARTHLGLSSTIFSAPSTPSSPSPLNPISRPTSNTVQNPLSQSSPRIASNGFLDFSKNTSFSPSSSPKSSPFLSYENIRSGSVVVPPFSHHKSVNGGADSSTGSGDLIDEHQLSNYLSFLNDSSSKGEEFVDPRVPFGLPVNNESTHLHRRSFSASDACLGTEDAGFCGGYKPCLYFARGFCKNGDNCKFSHGGFADNVDDINGAIVGSPGKLDVLYHQQEEMMRMRAVHQQRLATAQFMGGVSPPTYERNMNLPWQQQNDSQRAAALMLGEEIYKFNQSRAERNELLAMGLVEKANSASRQIYLTFPADSTFKDEDVSNYFSMFGLVQDVRIPYQQKRMFGFVTFVHPETVKLILSRGNPHFICDSRVLVKPYKEKGKVPDNRRQHLQQQLERGSYSPCSSPSGLDSRESFDLPLGAKMFYNAQEIMLRRRLEEQTDIQQAIELQRRRIMNLQLPEFKNDGVQHHQRSLSVGASVPLATLSHANRNIILPADSLSQDVTEGNGDKATGAVSMTVTSTERVLQQEVNSVRIQNNGDSDKRDHDPKICDVRRPLESIVEHTLPDSLFASPTKIAKDRTSNLFNVVEATENTATSTISSPENKSSLPCSSEDISSL